MDDFYVDDWLVRPAQCRLSKGGETIQVRARVMDLLTYFVARPGEVITKEQLLDGIWGTREISESALTRTVTELRHALHDDAATPRFLETIPKRGYRLIARVVPAGTAAEPEQVPRGMARHQRLTVTAVCVLMTIVAGGLWAVSRQPAAADASSPVAVGSSKAIPMRPSLVTGNPDAYDAYLRGLWHLRRGVTPNPHLSVRVQSRQTAVQELQRAVTLDPNFALARARLASAYTQRFFYDAADRALEEKAFVEIKKALALDPGLAEAYLARAQLTWNARNGFPHEEAIIDLRRAVSINPNLMEAHIELGKVYYHIGLTDKAIEANDRALRLDPSEPVSRDRRFRALIDAGRLAEVRLELDRIGNLGPYTHAEALLAIGDVEEAAKVLRRSEAAAPGHPRSDAAPMALLAVVYARLGQRDAAERMIAAAVPHAENLAELSHMHHAQYHLGVTHGLLGRRDEAMRWLTKAADEGFPSYPRFSTDPSLAPMRGHPAFDALLARLRQDYDRWRRRL